MGNWLYQIRIKVTQELSTEIRQKSATRDAQDILKIARDHGMRLVCTFDAFQAYCDEAEQNNISDYPLYDWTKATIENPEKKAKHLTSFAFYRGNEQIYDLKLAQAIETDLRQLSCDKILQITLVDSNPKNNPQPPSGS